MQLRLEREPYVAEPWVDSVGATLAGRSTAHQAAADGHGPGS